MKQLECPVCMEGMVPPIQLCTNGHNVCSNVQCCPTCRSEFSEIRNVALENIARSQKYACVNRQSGCLQLFSIQNVTQDSKMLAINVNLNFCSIMKVLDSRNIFVYDFQFILKIISQTSQIIAVYTQSGT